MSVIIGGDVCPTASNRELFIKGDAEALFGGEIVSLLNSAEHCIVNLETPLCGELHPIKKCGPALSAPIECVNGFKAAHIGAVSIANNHIMDRGEAGLRMTLNALNENGITFFGAGEDLLSAGRPYFMDACGRRIGVIAYTEHEFSCAEENKPGAAPFDPLYVYDETAEAKKLCDMLIVLYHGGKELYRYPSPRLRKVCRRFAEKGADIVLCQHSHCIGCMETHEGAAIVYGTGNFLFDGNADEAAQSGLLVTIGDNGKLGFKPVVKNGCGVRAASPEETEKIMSGFEERSRRIAEEGFVEKSYKEYAREQKYGVITDFYGRESFIFKVLNRLSGNRLRDRAKRRRYGEAGLLRIRNLIECETWRELSIEVLKNEIGESEK